MSNYIDVGSGTLNRSENRRSDKSPEFFGKIDIDGTEYRLAAWVRENPNNGKKFFSLAVSMESQDTPAKPDKPKPSSTEDIPF